MRNFNFTLPGGGTIEMSAPETLFIPRVLEEQGLSGYEVHSLATAIAICTLRRGPFFDIGANVGIFSLLVASETGRHCVACEPTPEPFKVLCETRGILPIKCKNIALSTEKGKATFYLSDRSDMSNSLNQAFRHSTTSIDVTVDTLDNIVFECPALIKIDTESTEPDVLAGASETIRAYEPPIILEVLANRTEDRLNEFLSATGYTAYQITSDRRWEPCSQVTGDPTHTNTNWLFTMQPLEEIFWLHLDAWRWRLSRCL